MMAASIPWQINQKKVQLKETFIDFIAKENFFFPFFYFLEKYKMTIESLPFKKDYTEGID